MPILVSKTVAEKPVVWLGSSRDDLRAFPADARQVAGFHLWAGSAWPRAERLEASAKRGTGVREIRVRTGVAHRVVYLATFEEAVYVLHAFEKRSQRTPKRELELARQRLRALLKQRPRGGR